MKISQLLTLFSYICIFILHVLVSDAFAAMDLEKEIVASFDSKYDSNVNSKSSSEEDDYIQSVALGLRLHETDKRGEIDILTSIVQNHFLQNSSYNFWEKKFDVDYKKVLGLNDRIYCSNHFTHTQESQGDEITGEKVSNRYDYYSNKFEGAFLKNIFSKFNELKIKYKNEFYAAVDSTASNWNLNKINLEWNHVFDSNNNGFIGYEHTNKYFETGSVGYADDVYIGFGKKLTNQLAVQVKGGCTSVKPYDNGSLVDTFFIAKFIKDISSRGQYGVTMRKENTFSSGVQDVVNVIGTSFYLTYNLLKNIKFNFATSWSESDFENLDIRDKTVGLNASLDYVFKENINVLLNYKFTAVDSTSDSRTYNKNIFGFQITYVF